MMRVENVSRPVSPSPSPSPLVLHCIISNGSRQIRVLFERDTKTWVQMREIIANILVMDTSDLDFVNSSTLGNLDEEDDGSCEYLNRLAVYSCVVQNKTYIASVEKQLSERRGEHCLHIRLLSGERYTFAMNIFEETVADLKHCLEMKLGLLSKQQKLLFANSSLNENTLLLGSVCGLQSGSEIMLVKCFFDGVMPQVSARDAIFKTLAPLTVYDANEKEIKFFSKPFLFRAEV